MVRTYISAFCLTAIFLLTGACTTPETKEEKMILAFTQSIFNDEHDAKAIIKRYMDVDVTDDRSAAIALIKRLRQNVNTEREWLLPKGNWVKNSTKVISHIEGKQSLQYQLPALENNQNVYYLVDKNETQILMIFHLNAEGKIKSFDVY